MIFVAEYNIILYNFRKTVMADDVAELNPSLIMAASLIYMSSIDGTIAQQEWGS